MFKKKKKELDNRTPRWFKNWHSSFFTTVDTRSARNERLIYIILGAVLILNTAGNYWHEEIIEIIVKLFGG